MVNSPKALRSCLEWPSPHGLQSSGVGECHVMGAAQISCICLGLLMCSFIAFGLLRQSVKDRMFIHTMLGRKLWHGGLGSSPMNFVQMGYTNLCIHGIPVWMPMVIFRHIHKITTGYEPRNVCLSACLPVCPCITNCNWMDYCKNLCLRIFWYSVKTVQVSLKSDKNKVLEMETCVH